MSSDNGDHVVPLVVIVLHLPMPFDLVELSFSTPKLMQPTITSDPPTTIFDCDWQTTIFHKTIQMVEESTLLDHQNILDEDSEHFTKLQQVLEYPNIPQ
jgi:hypothetical protein